MTELPWDNPCSDPLADVRDFIKQYGNAGKRCGTYWGSHGCDLPLGHSVQTHVCGSRDPEGMGSTARIIGESSPDSYGTTRWPAEVYFVMQDGSVEKSVSSWTIFK